jgi:hypothetical protein
MGRPDDHPADLLPPSVLARYDAAIELFLAACRRHRSNVIARKATDAELEQLQSLGIRGPMLELFRRAVVELIERSSKTYRLWPSGHMHNENRLYGPGFEINPMGLVVIGSSNSGDSFALDFASPANADGLPRVLLVDHEYRYKTLADVFARAHIAAPGPIEYLIAESTETGLNESALPRCV